MFDSFVQKKGASSGAEVDLTPLFKLAGFFIVGGGLVAYRAIKKNSHVFYSMKKPVLLIYGLTSFSVGLALFAVLDIGFSIPIYVQVYCIFFGLVVTTASLTMLFSPIWLPLVCDEDRITVSVLKRKTKNFDQLIPMLEDKQEAPLGLSLRTNRPVTLPTQYRTEHCIVSGATGQGKTTAMITVLKHSFKHGHPVIIIDPKGDVEDRELIRSEAIKMGVKASDFKVFSLSAPEISNKYNPLSGGTVEQNKSKLMKGLDLSHEYYGAQASKFLGAVLDAMDFLGREINIQIIQEALVRRQFLTRILEELNQIPPTREIEILRSKVESASKIDKKDLAGLSAQIEDLICREFSNILTPSESEPQIRLSEVLHKAQVVYFQLNVSGYSHVGSKLGKLIIQDLKILASRIHAGQEALDYNFAACFIDEFGSFATKDFSDFLKQVRSTKIGVTMLCQGMADLRAVSPEFEEQVLGNTLTKIIFRQDINNDVENWSAMAGTVDSLIQTHQTSSSLGSSSKTGKGSLHEGKKMKIDFDVFKSLTRGQGVLIDKGRGIQDVFSVWNSKEEKKPEYADQVPTEIVQEIRKKRPAKHPIEVPPTFGRNGDFTRRRPAKPKRPVIFGRKSNYF